MTMKVAKHLSIVCLASILVAGCSSTTQTPEQIAAREQARQVCKDEAPTGSIMKRSRCRSKAQQQADRAAAQEMMRNRTSLSTGSSESP